MTCDIICETEKTLGTGWEDTVRRVVERCLEWEDCPYEAEVSVTLTDDEGIRALNRQFRGIDRAMDVLSFPMVQYPSPSEFSVLEDGTAEVDCFNPETGELLLGDIVLSADRILEQAAQYGHSVTRELAFLVAHSMLHLFGYDHMEERERTEMEDRQRAILDAMGIVR